MIQVICLLNKELPAEGKQKNQAGRFVEQPQHNANRGQPDNGKQHIHAIAWQHRHPFPAVILELESTTRIPQTIQKQVLNARPVTEDIPEQDRTKGDSEDGKGGAIDRFTQP